MERERHEPLTEQSHMNESQPTSTVRYQSAKDRCSEEPEPRQKSRGFERMDALPLSICLGKLTSR
jgi:hypothetical protein